MGCTYFFTTVYRLHTFPRTVLSGSFDILKENIILNQYFMHTDLFGKQPCCRMDNNILSGEYIRDDAQASGQIHKTNPFRVIMTGRLCICTRVYVLLSVSYVSVWVCACFCLRASCPIENVQPNELDSGHFISRLGSIPSMQLLWREALPTTSFGDKQTGHIKAGDKKEQRHESSASLSLLCSVEQNVITEGNHPKPMMLQSFRKGTRGYMQEISRKKDGTKEMTTGWLSLCL